MSFIKKDLFLKAILCPRFAWLMKTGQVPNEMTIGEQFIVEQGKQIGEKARELYPNGVLVDETNHNSATMTTQGLLNKLNVATIFEGSFSVGNFLTKADILRRQHDDDWQLIEVKSSVRDKAEFIDDMAYTTMVIQHSGLNVSNISLMLLSRDFRNGMESEDLFVQTDHTDGVLNRVEAFELRWEEIDELLGNEEPESELCFECRHCKVFNSCQGTGIENPIFDIPRLSESKFEILKELGLIRIEDIPIVLLLTENQKRVKDSVQSGGAFVGPNLRTILGSVSWPAFFLDFETVMTAIPLYPDVAPYTQIPTQYSIHKYSEFGQFVTHLQYLVPDPRNDCRRELAERLILELEEEGSIIVYGSFENTIITDLKEIFPELRAELDSLLNRLVNLQAIIKNNFYHPDFHGSLSIKQVLPVLVPNMTYENLEIADGLSAIAVFAYLALGRYQNLEVDSMRTRLLEYCKKDTDAEVKVYEKLVEYC